MANHDDEPISSLPKLSPFTGANDKVFIDRWIAIFDFTIADRFKTDIERIKGLSSYLKDDALNWYADSVIPDAKQISWLEVKTRIIQRFGKSELHPLIAAQRRKLMPKETVKDYFEDKMRYLRRAKLDEEAMAASLTEGMPQSYKIGLHAAQLKTTNNWIAVALSLEKDQDLNRSRPHPSSHHPKPSIYFQSDDDGLQSNSDHSDSSTPSVNYRNRRRRQDYTPRCQICKKQGKKEFHWHRDCPLNKSSDSSLPSPDPHLQSNTMVKHSNHAQTDSAQDFITIRVKIGQVQTNAILDTGANIHVISSKFVRQLNLKVDDRLATRIKVASGFVKSLGVVQFPLSIASHTNPISAHVLDNNFPLMLGTTIGQLFPIHISLPKMQASIEDLHSHETVCLSIESPRSGQPQLKIDKMSNLQSQPPTTIGKVKTQKHNDPKYTTTPRNSQQQTHINSKPMVLSLVKPNQTPKHSSGSRRLQTLSSRTTMPKDRTSGDSIINPSRSLNHASSSRLTFNHVVSHYANSNQSNRINSNLIPPEVTGNYGRIRTSAHHLSRSHSRTRNLNNGGMTRLKHFI